MADSSFNTMDDIVRFQMAAIQVKYRFASEPLINEQSLHHG